MLLYFTEYYSIHKLPRHLSPDVPVFIIYKKATDQKIELKGEVGKVFYKQILEQSERLISDDAFEEMVDAICAKLFSTVH